MKLIIIPLFSLFFMYSTLLHAEGKIYKWVDEDGTTYFSDTATPDTEEITATNQNLFSAEVLKTDENHPAKNDENINEEEVVEYQAEIISPQDDAAIRSNEGTLEVHVNISPEKKNTHKLQLYLDGQALGQPQISSTIRALNVGRGTHQVQAHLLDEKGKVLAKTQIVTVHLQRVSIKSAASN